jgi:hypothetical protein
MKRIAQITSIALLSLLFAGTGGPTRAQIPVTARPAGESWTSTLNNRVDQFGVKNWIVIADASFPSLSRAGIETVVTQTNQLDVIDTVLDKLTRFKHLRAVAYTDDELNFLSEKDSPGASAFRKDLKSALGNRKVQTALHEQMIERLEKSAERYHILILKTERLTPYCTLYFELESNHWSPEAEQRLREAMKK